MSFLFMVFCIFQIIIDVKNIKYIKVNNILSVLKVCASLICAGGISPGVYVSARGGGVMS